MLELFFMVFVASPGGVSQLLGDEIEAGPRLSICHDPRLPEKFLVGRSRRRERLPRFVLSELQVNHLCNTSLIEPGSPQVGLAILSIPGMLGQQIEHPGRVRLLRRWDCSGVG